MLLAFATKVGLGRKNIPGTNNLAYRRSYKLRPEKFYNIGPWLGAFYLD
jgi:hypothetical protein